MTKQTTMERRHRRNRIKKNQPEIHYKKSKLRKPRSYELSNDMEQTLTIHKTVYLPDFDDFETLRRIEYRDIQTLLG